jgi:signal transduction histidine kinase
MGEHARSTRQRVRSDPRGPRQRRSSKSSADELSQAIVAATTDGIVAVDDADAIRFANEAAVDLLGLPAGDVVGLPLGHEIAPGQGAEIELAGPGGPRVLDVRTTTTSLAGERLRVAVLRDATQRKQSERALEAVLDQQSAALAVAAHELHSPLAAIGVLAHVLADQDVMIEVQERAKLAERIGDLAGRLQMLMRRLLATVQIEPDGAHATPEPVRVLEVIIDQLALVNVAQKAVQVHCSPALTASVDRAELTMMLANYVDNALAYAEQPIEIIAAKQNEWTEIEVRDHGPGVPADFEPLLFERFARAPQAERRAAGIGLGLWIVRTLARAAGGDAWYEPGEDGGSRFLLRLPAAMADA